MTASPRPPASPSRDRKPLFRSTCFVAAIASIFAAAGSVSSGVDLVDDEAGAGPVIARILGEHHRAFAADLAQLLTRHNAEFARDLEEEIGERMRLLETKLALQESRIRALEAKLAALTAPDPAEAPPAAAEDVPLAAAESETEPEPAAPAGPEDDPQDLAVLPRAVVSPEYDCEDDSDLASILGRIFAGSEESPAAADARRFLSVLGELLSGLRGRLTALR